MRKKIKGVFAAVFALVLVCRVPDMVVFAQEPTMGEKMQNAAFNTVLGMGTVFVMLILMAVVIYAFRIIPILQKKFSAGKKAEIKTEESAPEVSVTETTQADGTDDRELVAVIAAAIASYEQIPTDDFVVRTIKRRKI